MLQLRTPSLCLSPQGERGPQNSRCQTVGAQTMTTQTINGATVEIAIIMADGKTNPAATLDARETATVEAVDAALRATESFQTAYPSSRARASRIHARRGGEVQRALLPALPVRRWGHGVLGPCRQATQDRLQEGDHRGCVAGWHIARYRPDITLSRPRSAALTLPQRGAAAWSPLHFRIFLESRWTIPAKAGSRRISWHALKIRYKRLEALNLIKR